MKTKIAQLMTFAFCLAGSAAAAATETTWTGGSGGTEAEPLDIYNANNIASGKLPSDGYHISFSVDSLTHLTNSFANATTTRIADNIRFISGDFIVHGPLRFYTLDSNVENGTASVVKKGDWWIDYYFMGGRAAGHKTAFTNESGNMTMALQYDSVAAKGQGAKFDIVSKRGNWTVTGNKIFYFAGGKDSSSTIDKHAGDWSFAYDVYFASAEGSTATLYNRGGAFNVNRTIYFGYAKNASANVYVSGGSFKSTGQYGIIIGKDTSGSGRVYFEVSGGAVTNTAGNMCICESTGSGSSAEMRVTGGEVCAQTGSIFVGASGAGTLTIDGGLVSAPASGVSFCGNSQCVAGRDCFLYLNGGTLAAKTVTYGSGAANGTFTFNGGTLKALAAGTLIENKAKLAVKVGSNGGTVNANAKAVTIGEPILEDSSSTGGGMTFKGGGTVSLAGGSTYTGATTVEIGTTLSMASPSCIPGALAVTLPAGLAAGRYVVVTTTGSTAFDASILDGVVAPQDCELALADGGKTVVCVYKRDEMAAGIWLGTKNNDLCDGENWSNGTVPNGVAATISCAAAATLVCSGSFTPTGITFPAGSALVTISGPGAISGISSIVNNTTLHHVFNCQVTCPDGVTPNITRTEAAYMTFAGGLLMYDAPKTGNNTFDYWSGKVTLGTGGTLRFDTASKNFLYIINGSAFSVKTACVDHVYIDTGAKFVADRLVYNGCCRVSNKGWYNTVFDNGNGTLRVGEIRTTGDAVLFHSFASADMYGGTIIADKLMCATTVNTGGSFPYPVFMLNCGQLYGGGAQNGTSAGEGVWAIGPGGLAFPTTAISDRSHYETLLGKSLGGRPAATLYSFADWTLMAHPNARGNCALGIGEQNGGFIRIDTSHYNIGEPEYDTGATGHTVTLDGSVQGKGWMLATGTGKLVFANENNTLNGANGLLVSNSVTIVVKSGCKPGASKVTLRDTSTLELKKGASVGGGVDAGIRTTLLLSETGTATVGGQLWMRNSSKMKFRIDGSENAKVLAGSYKIEKGVEISFTEDSVPLVGRSYTLTQDAGLNDTMLDPNTSSYFKLADGIQGSLSIVGGELVYNAPEYFYIKVADSDLPVPMQWIVDNGAATTRDSIQSVADALAKPGANGIPVWQSYCLGLEPNEASSVVLCEAAANQPPAGKVGIAARNLNVPEGLSGVTVTAYLDKSTNGIDWSPAVSSATVSSGSAVFEPEIGDGISFFE